MQPVIATSRLILRPATEIDRDDLIALERDAEVMRFINGGQPTPDGGVAPDAGFLTPRGGEPGVWTVIEKERSTFVGWCALQPRGERIAELGYRLRRAMWGQGFGSEAARALVAWGFQEAGLTTIVATTMAINQGSRRVMEKAGLRYVRTVHLDWPDPLPGSEMGDVEYELTLDAWAANDRHAPSSLR